ncbi:acyl-CoA dehydrogenase [Nitratireductor sp. CAU 1489]|uniref:Acyl-CoA dehydrogenase n=1 Tax=Nitratireductor arenosus TaxID=2682096 RepID=A0A844QEG1_9HYPH|nr:acyl-CoA dehydrogenase [Nitratireductor arenosus]MVA96410.1 acyl-CoA dehydrogenase [Nitratireductor arenosus]
MITIDRTDLAFQLHDLLDTARLAAHSRFADYDRAAIDGVLDTAERIAINHFLPHAALLDENEPAFVDGKVVMDDAVGEALRHFREAGFFGAAFDREWGGMQMPETVRQAASFIFMMANIGTSGYPFLTAGAANLLASFGTVEQKERFLRPMVEGRFYGTMCLSEPQAGSSLGDIVTSASPADDGSYRISGRKMWISGGDQEISDNIVHMVLARIEGAPPGVKGISLFIVPKYRLDPDGMASERNGVVLAGLNHKMGYRGTTNTLLHFGEDEPAIGYLLGEPHRGLAYMFQMMNEARIGVGLGAVALAAAGYRASLAYARERPQGRHPDGKDPSGPPVAIIEHADIKRLLLAQKAAVEGALALVLYSADLVDRIREAEDEQARREDELLLDLLTPLVKSWPSEYCLEANKHAIQVLGGYGYTRDYPVERLYRDNRLNPIHEGTHGIQGMDLLGRKITQAGGAGVRTLAERVMADIKMAHTLDGLAGFAETLATHLSETVATTGRLAHAVGKNPRLGLANATIYLDMLGHVVIAWMWLRQAVAAVGKRANGDGDPDFLDGKLAACRYFFAHELPATRVKRDLLDSLDDTTLSMKPDWF